MVIENGIFKKGRGFKFIKLRYLDLSVKIGVPGARDLIWLQEFLCPPFEVIKSRDYDCEIRLFFDDKKFDELSLENGTEGNRINGFILDTRIVGLVPRRPSGNFIVLFDEEFFVFYIVSRDKRKIAVLAHSAKSISHRTALGRVVTELAMNDSRRNAGLFLHASALSAGGRGIVIAGPKNSGKTSLLMYLLRNLPSRFISNDRVLVRQNGAGYSIRGVPTVITVSEKSLRLFPGLGSGFSKFNFHDRYTVDEIFARKCVPYKLETGEFTLSSAQFCRLLRAEPSACSRLSVIVFPRIVEEPGSPGLKRLSGPEALKRLRESRFARTIRASESYFCLEEKKHGVFKNYLDYGEFSLKLAAETACYDCFLGIRAFRDTSVSEAIENLILQTRETSR